MRPQAPWTHRRGGRRFLVRLSSELKVLKVLKVLFDKRQSKHFDERQASILTSDKQKTRFDKRQVSDKQKQVLTNDNHLWQRCRSADGRHMSTFPSQGAGSLPPPM